MKLIHEIRSGGQTGVDRAALDTALKYKIPICGWVPKNGWAEDISEPPGLLEKYPTLQETPLQDVKQRTNWNARDSHATLIFGSNDGTVSEGTDYTVESLEHYHRPYFYITEDNIDQVIESLKSVGFGLTVNIAGARESEQPGIYNTACNVFDKFFDEVNQ